MMWMNAEIESVLKSFYLFLLQCLIYRYHQVNRIILCPISTCFSTTLYLITLCNDFGSIELK